MILVKFIYSEKATKFCEIFTLILTVCTVVKSKVKIAKFCGLLRIYELYKDHNISADIISVIFTYTALEIQAF